MKFQFTKKEEELLILFLALHQYKNSTLTSFESCYHPIMSKIVKESKIITVPKELIKSLKEYHPCHFVTWLYGGKEHILNKHQTQLLQKFIKEKNLYDLIKINKQTLKKTILEEERKWANGLKILKSTIKELPFTQPVNLVLNLFDAFGAGYGVKTNKGRSYIVIGLHREPLYDQIILHEYMHIVFADWLQTDKGKRFISLLLKEPLKDKWQKAKRPWYPYPETIAEEYFLRTLTLRFLPKNLKPAFIKEQNSQGFKHIDRLSKWLLTLPD